MHIEQWEPMGAEKRGAFRYPVPAKGQESVLRVGKKQMPVRVLDESAGGFAVLVDRHPGVGTDDVVRLCTESGWHEVRVVHVCEHEPATSDGNGGGENEEAPQFRVGLERVRDLTPWEAERGLRAWFDRLGIGGFLPLCSTTVVVGVVLAVSVTAALAAGAVVFRQRGHSGSAPNSALSQRAKNSPRAASRSPGQARQPREPSKPDSGQSADARSASRTSSPAEDPAGTVGSDSPVEQSSSRVSSRNAGDSSRLAATIRRLPGASPFALKEVARELGLSQSQQEEIGRIVELSGEAVRQIRMRWPDQTRQQHAEKRRILLDEARWRVLELLTKEQRDRWEALQRGTATD
jgi:hypothetical protein